MSATLNISWTAPTTGAGIAKTVTSYTIGYRVQGTSTYTVVTGIVGTNHSISGLVNGAIYEGYIKSICNSCESVTVPFTGNPIDCSLSGSAIKLDTSGYYDCGYGCQHYDTNPGSGCTSCVPATPTPTPTPTAVPATATPTPTPTPTPTAVPVTPTPTPTAVPDTPTPTPIPDTNYEFLLCYDPLAPNGTALNRYVATYTKLTNAGFTGVPAIGDTIGISGSPNAGAVYEYNGTTTDATSVGIINAVNELDCSGNAIESPTPTPTPTANTSGYYDCGYGCQYYAVNPGCDTCDPTVVYFDGYTGSTATIACNQTNPLRIYYTGSLGVNTVLYTESGMISTVPTPGFYWYSSDVVLHVGLPSVEDGKVTETVSCPVIVTPTPTPALVGITAFGKCSDGSIYYKNGNTYGAKVLDNDGNCYENYNEFNTYEDLQAFYSDVPLTEIPTIQSSSSNCACQ